MKKYVYFLITFVFLLFPGMVFAISPVYNPLLGPALGPIIGSTQPINFFVNDYADILSEETEDYIFQKSVALNNVDGTQIVVLTVENLEGYSIEEYANELFNSWMIGDKSKNNGLLLLLALEERQFRVEVGEGLEGILPDGKTGRFQDEYIIPYLKNDEWDKGIKNGYDAFYSEIVKLNNLDLEYEEGIPSYNSDDNEDNDSNILFEIVVVLGWLTGMFAGSWMKKMPKEKGIKATLLYFIIWVLLFIICVRLFIVGVGFLFFNLFCFIPVRFGVSTSGGVGFGRSSGRSSSRGFSGGGGRSSGGGSSRRF